MQAAVLLGPRQVSVTHIDVGDTGAGDVTVAVEGCGVCGSNLPLWEGRPWFDYPLAPGAPGHEGWGRVVATGTGVRDVAPGDRVAFLGDRAFADRAVVPARDVVRLPDTIDGPFPGEAFGCGFNVASRSGFVAGQTVAVVGVGFIGAVVTALAAGAGCRVVALSRRRYSLDIAEAMGADDLVVLDDGADAVAQVAALTGGALCDVVVEAVGLQEPLDLAGELTREGGRLVIAGFHQDGRRSVDLQLWNWRGIDVVNAHERDRATARAGMAAAVEAVAGGTFDPRPLLTHALPLAEIDLALDLLVERPAGFLKAVVVT